MAIWNLETETNKKERVCMCACDLKWKNHMYAREDEWTSISRWTPLSYVDTRTLWKVYSAVPSLICTLLSGKAKQSVFQHLKSL